jgi:hypothetical protein
MANRANGADMAHGTDMADKAHGVSAYGMGTIEIREIQIKYE